MRKSRQTFYAVELYVKEPMSIGLKRGTVALSEYSEQWPIEFEKERSVLLELAGSGYFS